VGCSIRPDITAVCENISTDTKGPEESKSKEPENSNLKDADKTVNEELTPYWRQIVTFSEAKTKTIRPSDLIQAVGYASTCPEGRPEVAGMLYLIVCSEGYVLAWSDASRVVHSDYVNWSDKDWLNCLYRYVCTLYQPVPSLTQVDKTIELVEQVEGTNDIWWRIMANKECFLAKKLHSTPAYGKQTFVWITQPEMPKDLKNGENHKLQTYIIKDSWPNVSRRYREIDLYDKVKGVRGFAQLRESTSKLEGTRRHPYPETSSIHSRQNCKLKQLVYVWQEGKSPKTEKVFMYRRDGKSGSFWKAQANLLNIARIFGSFLRHCTTLWRVSVFFSIVVRLTRSLVAAHQVLVNHKGILHRDISPNNILINPKHNEGCIFKSVGKEETYIQQVLHQIL
jgi:hypothetical protein